jgi:beta-glucosidase
MYLSTDGSNPTASQLQASKDIKPNKELLMELGKSFDSELWEQLLDQMTVAEMDNLIQLGGYKTCAVETIGKKYMLDNDGGSGLNRHIQEADKGNNPDRSSWTLFPSTNMLAASWNKRLCYNYGLAIAAEAVTSGIDGWYSPACNMHRSLYDGRIAEYPSEDPLFAGIVTAEQVRGAMNNGIYTYVKHFAVNENENGRAGIKTWLTEQSLRELYLRPFEIAVKRGGTVGIMASMNCIGNTLAKYNGALMDDVLRNEWGFHGTVITDWEGSGNMLKGLYAGLDLWLTGAQVKVSKPINASNAMEVTYARKACHNILWAKVAAYHANQTHDPEDDNITVDTDIIVARTVHFGWWYVGLWGISGTIVVGTVVYCLYAFGVIKFKTKTKDLNTTAKKE